MPETRNTIENRGIVGSMPMREKRREGETSSGISNLI
jgi:hypothetical protein